MANETYYWSDGLMTDKDKRYKKDKEGQLVEDNKEIILAKTITNHGYGSPITQHYVLVDSGCLYDPNTIDVRYRKRPWKFMLVKHIMQMNFYLSYLGFKTPEEHQQDEYTQDKTKIRPVSRYKGLQSYLRKAERFI